MQHLKLTDVEKSPSESGLILIDYYLGRLNIVFESGVALRISTFKGGQPMKSSYYCLFVIFSPTLSGFLS